MPIFGSLSFIISPTPSSCHLNQKHSLFWSDSFESLDFSLDVSPSSTSFLIAQLNSNIYRSSTDFTLTSVTSCHNLRRRHDAKPKMSCRPGINPIIYLGINRINQSLGQRSSQLLLCSRHGKNF